MTNPWDVGVSWRVETVTPAVSPVLPVPYVMEKVLRVFNGSVDYDHVEALIVAATAAAERETGRAVPRQTLRQTLDRFTCPIVLQRPPLVSVLSVSYVDVDGVTQSLSVSPAGYQLSESGDRTKARLYPLYGEAWPETRCQPDAVTIEYLAGYPSDSSDPEYVLITRGIALMVSEMYRIPNLSIQGASTSVPALLGLDRFWRPVVD